MTGGRDKGRRTMKKMTMRDRMLAVVQGREHDQVPFAMYEIILPAESMKSEPLKFGIGTMKPSLLLRLR
jgi:hypothetical protein